MFNGLFLAVMAAYVLWMGVMRLMEPMPLSTTVMLYAAAGGIVTEVVAFWLLYERQKGNLNIKGAFWHILQTFVGLIIILSALVVRLRAFLRSTRFSAWPLASSSSGPPGALSILLWTSCCRARPKGSTWERWPQRCKTSVSLRMSITFMLGIWPPAGTFYEHLRVRSFAQDGDRVLRAANDMLKSRFGIYLSTLQVERSACPPSGARRTSTSAAGLGTGEFITSSLGANHGAMRWPIRITGQCA